MGSTVKTLRSIFAFIISHVSNFQAGFEPYAAEHINCQVHDIDHLYTLYNLHTIVLKPERFIDSANHSFVFLLQLTIVFYAVLCLIVLQLLMETQKSSLPGSEVPVACATERVCDCELLALPWTG